MPLVADYEELLASKVADADNAGRRPGRDHRGAVPPALHRRRCRGPTSTSPRWATRPADEFEYTKGATGFGARALLHWLELHDPLGRASR